MITTVLAAILLTGIPEAFNPVSGFADLDFYATPDGFSLLLVVGDDLAAAEETAMELLSALDSLPECAEVGLWVILPEAEGYAEVAGLCCSPGGYPVVVSLVGHCGFLELDREYIVSEVIDSWATWGDPGSRRTGICNFCRRCNT